MSDFDKSRIERLKRSLYSRKREAVPKETRSTLSNLSDDEEIKAPKDWGGDHSFNIPFETGGKKDSFFNRFLGISLIFFLIASAIALFIFFGGINTISSNNVEVSVVSPSSISSGEELDMNFSTINNNNVDLTDAVLFIDYPEGVRSIEVGNKTIIHDRIPLDIIAKGQSKDYPLRVLVFGQKDSIKEFDVHIEYKVSGSNAVFSKEKKYSVTISSSPLLLNVTYPKEVNSGQDLTLILDVTSNSNVVIKDTLVKVEYPYGFTYKDSNIKPSRDNSIWNLGDLKNGDRKTLTIRGVLLGQDLEERSFTITAGTKNQTVPVDIEIPLVNEQLTIGIRKSFFDLSLSNTQTNLSIGQTSPINISWHNTLLDKVTNNRIEAVISGNVLDKSTVRANDGGFFRSSDNTIYWDKNTTSNLGTILPAEDGQVIFLVGPLNDAVAVRSIRNPHIDLHVTMTGTRIGQESTEISSVSDLTLKFPTTFTLTAKSYRNVGPFTNTGPVPLHSDQESTYTIVWTITNTTNDLKNTMVTAILPTGVAWKGEISPASERIAYNDDNRVITWNVGNISSGAGFSNSPREVYFKVGITPSVSQIKTTPELLKETKANTTDTYTDTEINASAQAVTTRFFDPSYKFGDESVVK